MAEPRTPTAVLREEHQLILRVLDVLQVLLEKGDAGEWDFDAWQECVEFFRLFADACHHGKEEDLLFPELESRGMPREGGPIAVMLFEHKQGRGFVARMVKALEDARGGEVEPLKRLEHAARAYLELLRAHIHKEDNVLFKLRGPDEGAAGDPGGQPSGPVRASIDARPHTTASVSNNFRVRKESHDDCETSYGAWPLCPGTGGSAGPGRCRRPDQAAPLPGHPR
jgi:hemerythrin-like domain-containing protein